MGEKLKARRTFCIPPAAVLVLVAILILTDRPTADSATNLTSKPTPSGSSIYDVRAFGARGDGKTIDTPAINKAIESATAAGGGTVRFPAGIYLSFSIHLKSHITLYFDQGATILAADSNLSKDRYDLPEPNEWDMYQDFGHSHWQNSLIWGIGLENISILGPGLIDRQASSVAAWRR